MSSSAAEGLSEADGIARLKANPDLLAKERGAAMAATITRLAKLERSAEALDNPDRFVRWETFPSTFDTRVAARAYEAYQPAVPTTADGFVAGLVGFLMGGGLVHLLTLPIRYRHKLFLGRSGANSRRSGAFGGTEGAASAVHQKNRKRQSSI